MSNGPQLIRPQEPAERNWLPMAIAVGVVLVAVVAGILLLGHGKKGPTVTPVSAQADPYAASLPITDLKMSESSNLAGGKVTYVDGVIANTGAKTVAVASLQVLFRNFQHEVVQNDTQALQLIRTREPYVDLEPVTAAPLAPGKSRAFRLSFDGVSPDWDGAFPEIRIVHAEAR